MSQATTINLDDAPKWDYRVTVRGIDFPMTSPIHAEDHPVSSVPSQGEIDAMTNRWPGLLVWIKRFIMGAPRVQRGDLPQDGGAQHTRDMCIIILGEENTEFINTLTTGECAQLYTAYLGVQDEWFENTRRFAASMVEQLKMESQPIEASPNHPGMTTLVPGGNHPIQLDAQRHPLIKGDSE